MPGRFLQEQGGIEGILSEAAKGVYSRSEKWGVGKALLGAVQGLQSGSNSARRLPGPGMRWSLDDGKAVATIDKEQLTSRIEALEQRNKALAKMLENAVNELWEQEKQFSKEKEETASNALTLAIAKVQFVQVYLEDSSVPLVQETSAQEAKNELDAAIVTSMPSADATVTTPAAAATETIQHEIKVIEAAASQDLSPTSNDQQSTPALSLTDTSDIHRPKTRATKDRPGPSPFHHPRPSLAQSSFSWILGEDQRKSSFVSASPLLPEDRRLNPARAKASFLFGDDKHASHRSKDNKSKKGNNEKTEEIDGFTLGTLKGVPEELQKNTL